MKNAKLKLKIKNFCFLLCIFAICYLIFAIPSWAQEPTPLGTIGEGEGFGPWSGLSKIGDIGLATTTFNKIISNIIGVMTISAGIYFIFQFMISAYGWLAAGSDQQAIQGAQQRMTNAVMGLVIIVAAYALISLIGAILGFEILSPGAVLPFVRP